MSVVSAFAALLTRFKSPVQHALIESAGFFFLSNQEKNLNHIRFPRYAPLASCFAVPIGPCAI